MVVILLLILMLFNLISDGLAMDEDDYDNTPKELRKLWKGLK